ncbi:MAG: hypothetical protein V4537_14580 [Pseudomonadota bacterium]
MTKIESVLKKIDISSFPIPLKLGISNCGTKVSAALQAPDTHGEGRGIGGFWPAHSVQPLGEDERDIVQAAREAVSRAVSHEIDEHFKFEDKLVVDPHPAV